jgi:hypothetical protein
MMRPSESPAIPICSPDFRGPTIAPTSSRLPKLLIRVLAGVATIVVAFFYSPIWLNAARSAVDTFLIEAAAEVSVLVHRSQRCQFCADRLEFMASRMPAGDGEVFSAF